MPAARASRRDQPLLVASAQPLGHMPQSGRSLKPACGREWYSGWRRIFVVPQLDGRPLWEPPATPLFASHGTREGSSDKKAPFKPKDIWALRVRLQMENRMRELARFNLGISHKLRGVAWLRSSARRLPPRPSRLACCSDAAQSQRPVQIEITPAARDAAAQWIRTAALKSDDYLFPSRIHGSPHLGTRQYARVRHPICAANKSDADLSANKEPSRNSAASR